MNCSSLRSEEHTSELQSQSNLVCRLLLEKKKKQLTLFTSHSDGSALRHDAPPLVSPPPPNRLGHVHLTCDAAPSPRSSSHCTHVVPSSAHRDGVSARGVWRRRRYGDRTARRTPGGS